MLRWRPYVKSIAVAAAVAIMAVGCARVTYKLPDEFLNDGDLLTASIKAAVGKVCDNPYVKAENGPFALVCLDTENSGNLLYSRFDDALTAELSARGITVAAEGGEAESSGAAIKYRLVECRILNAKADGGRVKRIGRTVAHVRVYAGGEEALFWAGEYEGEFENVVPSKIVSKLVDERIEEIGPEKPVAGQNPFVEPLLVTGITGALIYLFAISASAQ